MDTLVSNAVHKFISALFHPRFPSISDSSWETTLTCTEPDLDAKRSRGLLALYSYLEQSLVRATRMTQGPPDLGPLREVILSDEVLERLLLKAGVCDSCGGPASEQVGRAFFVFADMVIMDRGVEEFASWFSDIFDPIISVAFEACVGCQLESAGSSLTKRLSLVYQGTPSKRRRTSLESSAPSPLIFTLSILQRLRQRQMLSTCGHFPGAIALLLASAKDQDLESDLAEQTAQRRIFSSPATSPATLFSSPPLASSTPRAPRTSTIPFNPTQDYASQLYHNSPPRIIYSTAWSRPVSAALPYNTAAPPPLLSSVPSDPNTTSMSEFQTRHTSAVSVPSATASHPIPVYVSPDDYPQSPVMSTISSSCGVQTHSNSIRDDSQHSIISISPELHTPPVPSIPSDVGVVDVFTAQFPINSTSSLCSAKVAQETQNLDRDFAAVVFIIETIDMVKRGELLPTLSVAAATAATVTTTTTTATVTRPAEAKATRSAVDGKTETRPSRGEVLRTLLWATRPAQQGNAVDARSNATKPVTRKADPDNTKKSGLDVQNDIPKKTSAKKFSSNKSDAGAETAAADTNKARKRKIRARSILFASRRRKPLVELANIPENILPPSFGKFPASLLCSVDSTALASYAD
ncbi:hypothetical protein MSAN_00363900 [Mycena sanguinolenta]|uniref:Uncharacterized protein n=1 Tax=Mycena sanguinolenta TaxID=230812 RepID=A0A8H7DGP7_9AGAR|nr:hypothetical protein MSAN_00363900 [Mycena sanguinolenta]